MNDLNYERNGQAFHDEQKANSESSSMEQSPHRFQVTRNVQENTPPHPYQSQNRNARHPTMYADADFVNGNPFYQNQYGNVEQNHGYYQAPPGSIFGQYQPETIRQVPPFVSVDPRSFYQTLPSYNINDPRASLPLNYSPHVALQRFNGDRYQHTQDTTHVPHQVLYEQSGYQSPQFAETSLYTQQLPGTQFTQTSTPSGPIESSRPGMPPVPNSLRVNTNISRAHPVRRANSVNSGEDRRQPIQDVLKVPKGPNAELRNGVLLSTYEVEKFLTNEKKETEVKAQRLEKFLQKCLELYQLDRLYTDPMPDLNLYERLMGHLTNLSVCAGVIAKRLILSGDTQELEEFEKKRKGVNRIVSDYKKNGSALTFDRFDWFYDKVVRFVIAYHFAYWRSQQSENSIKNWETLYPTKRGRSTRASQIKDEIEVPEDKYEVEYDI